MESWDSDRVFLRVSYLCGEISVMVSQTRYLPTRFGLSRRNFRREFRGRFTWPETMIYFAPRCLVIPELTYIMMRWCATFWRKQNQLVDPIHPSYNYLGIIIYAYYAYTRICVHIYVVDQHNPSPKGVLVTNFCWLDDQFENLSHPIPILLAAGGPFPSRGWQFPPAGDPPPPR